MEPLTRVLFPAHSLSEDVENKIFSYFIVPNRCGGLRVENIALLSTIAEVCKSWKSWVFDPVNGPFSILGDRIFNLIPKTTLKPIPANVVMGILNKNIDLLVAPWVEYIQKIDSDEEASPPTHIHPNFVAYEGTTPLESTIRLILKKGPKYEYLIDELCTAGLSPEFIGMGLKDVFVKHYEDADQCNRFDLANYLIENLKKFPQQDHHPSRYLQPHLKSFFHLWNHSLTAIYWFESQGCYFDTEHIQYWITSDTHEKFKDVLHSADIFCYLYDKYHASSDFVKGFSDLLMHDLIRRCLHPKADKYFEKILQSNPKTLETYDSYGLTPLCLILQNNRNTVDLNEKAIGYLTLLKDYANDRLLWDQRVIIHHHIVTFIKHKPSYGFFHCFEDRIGHLMGYLNGIKELFSTSRSFEEWLCEPYDDLTLHEINRTKNLDDNNGKELAEDIVNTESQTQVSLLHFIATWFPHSIASLLEKSIITTEMCAARNSQNQTILEASEIQIKLFDMLRMLISYGASCKKKEGIDFTIYLEMAKDPTIQKAYEILAKELLPYKATLGFEMLQWLGRIHSFPAFIDCSEIIKELGDYQRTDTDGNTLLHAFILHFLNANGIFSNALIKIVVAMIDDGVETWKRNHEGKSAADLVKGTILDFLLPLFE